MTGAILSIAALVGRRAEFATLAVDWIHGIVTETAPAGVRLNGKTSEVDRRPRKSGLTLWRTNQSGESQHRTRREGIDVCASQMSVSSRIDHGGHGGTEKTRESSMSRTAVGRHSVRLSAVISSSTRSAVGGKTSEIPHAPSLLRASVTSVVKSSGGPITDVRDAHTVLTTTSPRVSDLPVPSPIPSASTPGSPRWCGRSKTPAASRVRP